MNLVLSLSTAFVAIAAGAVAMFLGKGRSWLDRAGVVLMVLGGVGLTAGPFGQTVLEWTNGITRWVNSLDFALAPAIAGAMPVILAMVALGWVWGTFSAGHGTIGSAVVAVALPTLLFNVDGPFAWAAHGLLDLMGTGFDSLTDVWTNWQAGMEAGKAGGRG